MWWVKIFLKKKVKKKTLSLDVGRKKKNEETPNPNLSFITPLTLLNPLFTNNKIQLPFSFLVHVSWFFLCFFFTYRGYANSFEISSGSFHFKTLFSCPTAIENSGTFLDSTFVSNELISTNKSPLPNNKLFFFFLWLLHPGYISWVLDYLGSDWTQKR